MIRQFSVSYGTFSLVELSSGMLSYVKARQTKRRNKMRKVEVEIEGIAPILFNRFFDPESLDAQGSKKKTKKEYADEVPLKVYRDKWPNGYLGLPAINIKKCVLNGSRSATIKIGRKSAEPYMRATMFFDQEFVFFNKKTKKYDGVHEIAGNRPPRTGGKCLIKRPYLNEGWKMQFTLSLFDDRISSNMAKDALIEGGLLCAIGDHRPEYGRFKVNRFEEVK